MKMLPRIKIIMILAIIVMVSFACGKSTPKATSTPAIDSAATQAAQVAAEKATADAQAALDDKATADAAAAKATADAKATTDAAAAAKAAAEAKATADAKAAAEATAEAKAAAEAKATADAKSTVDAQAALDAKATADAKAAQEAAATATQEAKVATQTAVAAKATQAAEAILGVIQEDLAKVDLSTDTGRLGWMQTGVETIKLDTAWEAFYRPFAENLVASDFVLKTEVTWEAEGGLLICGFMFRSEASFATGTHYKLLYLRFSGYPGWDIETYKSGQFFSNVTGKVRVASAINLDNGATNKFVMIAEGNKFTVYINDQRIGSFYDDSKVRADGRFAFYGSEEAGVSSCKFENTWVWLLK
jgi:hypothetical protein